MRIGILTSGGDCPGINATIRGVCKTAINHYGMEVIGIHSGFQGLLTKDVESFTDKSLSGLLNLGGTMLGTSREKPFKKHGVVSDVDKPALIEKNVKELGLERYEMFEALNMGSQVTNEEFIAKAIELKADALLVSQTVTQKDIHIKNLTELVEMLEAEGLRDKVILACGGPRISHELAKELGYDAGFGMNTYADDVASFIAQELDRRMNH